ncbi:MAG: PD-(D/E)XK nuclease family protein [Colwellia sp.]
MMTQAQYLKLINNHSFEDLVEYSNQFDLFKMMGVRRKELVHSNILAAFFTPSESHGLGHKFVNEFLKQIPDKTFCGDAISSTTLQTAIGGNVRVYRELENIDLVLEFPEIKLVIGIENKIWADEQEKQLERYQEILSSRYPSYTTALIFLAPNRREPTTHNPELEVPIYCMSYAHILNCLSDDNIINAPLSAKTFISQFNAHIEKYLSRNKHMDELCWQIFKENEEAYGLMVKSYSKCIYRKIEEQFTEIQEKLISDSMFNDFRDKIELDFTPKADGRHHIICDLDIRLTNWPDNIAIRVYKWTWMGCFVYIKKAREEAVKNEYPATRNLPFAPVKYFEDEQISYFSELSAEASMAARKITSKGNEITEIDIAFTLNKIKELIDNTNEMLGHKQLF